MFFCPAFSVSEGEVTRAKMMNGEWFGGGFLAMVFVCTLDGGVDSVSATTK